LAGRTLATRSQLFPIWGTETRKKRSIEMEVQAAEGVAGVSDGI
jgi:hypothetical protein